MNYNIVYGDFEDLSYINKDALGLILRSKVIIYDALVNMNFLNTYCLNAERIYKVHINEKYEQRLEQLNSLVSELTQDYKDVVHLRGISNYLFHESHDTLDFLSNKDINIKIIRVNPFSGKFYLN
jgi:siroheme synthase